MSRIITESYEIHCDKPLPAVQWQSIQQLAPTPLPIDNPKQLPIADAAIITWTSAEWSAFDHVFLNSSSERHPYSEEWRDQWHPFPAEGDSPILYFQLVGIKDMANKQQRVLLIKSEVHLAHAPWRAGLEAMVNTVIHDAQVKKIISTGTAGGAALSQCLGDVILTNAAHLHLKKEENLPCSYNDTTITGSNLLHQTVLQIAVNTELMMGLDTIWNDSTIKQAIAELNHKAGTHYDYADIIDEPLKPENLHQVQISFAEFTPLLTTDYYYIAQPGDQKGYCFLEMDDAIIAHVAKKAGVEFGFIRNVSDPVISMTDSHGQPIAESVRDDWSGIIYKLCGFYTSFNSALSSWASIAGIK